MQLNNSKIVERLFNSVVKDFTFFFNDLFSILPYLFFIKFLLGMTSYDGILFVAEQNIGAILTFDVKSGDFIRKIVKGGDPHTVMIEQIVLSPC